MYAVKEIYYTLQGEGAQTGRAAVFCRFAGCNLWTGREEDREQAICQFCDTDFIGTDGPGGGKFSAPAELAEAIERAWPAPSSAVDRAERLVVFTGGEPSLQLDSPLIEELHRRQFSIAIETNGTNPLPPGIDWITVSPKAGAALVVTSGDELKLVYPQDAALPESFAALDFRQFFLQPMDGPNQQENTQRTADYCLAHPQWRVSLQTHKLIGLR